MTRRQSWLRALRAAFPHTIPVLTGYLVLGIAYGILMETKGYGPLWSTLMSAIAFGGSMQYAAIALLTTVFDPIQAFLLSLMVNARHLFYGVSMLRKYVGIDALRPFLIYWLTDETFSVLCTVEVPDDVERGPFYFWVSFLDYCYWVLGTLAGGLFGTFLTFNTTGMDFALTALFVVLFMEQLKGRQKHISGAIGLVCTVVALAVFGTDKMVIAAMVLILACLLAGRRKLCA